MKVVPLAFPIVAIGMNAVTGINTVQPPVYIFKYSISKTLDEQYVKYVHMYVHLIF